MAATVVLMLVTGDTIVKRNFAGQAAFCQKLQRSIDRCVADASILLLYQAMKFVSGEMVARFQKGPQNRIALFGLLQPHRLEVAVEDVFRLAYHLAGKAGLIIDPLLQHGGSEKSEYHPDLENEIHFQDAAAPA
jgi:hypothetical protein